MRTLDDCELYSSELGSVSRIGVNLDGAGTVTVCCTRVVVVTVVVISVIVAGGSVTLKEAVDV